MTKPKTPRKRRIRAEMDNALEDLARGRPMPWGDDEGDDDSVVPVPESEPESEPEETPEEIAAPAKPVEARVALRVYLAACGHRWDQMQGFKVYAKTKDLGPLSMIEWGEAYQDYLNRPIK